jgi:hypothetical protein
MQLHIARIPDRINLTPQPNVWHHVAVQGVVEIHARVKLTATMKVFFLKKRPKNFRSSDPDCWESRIPKIKGLLPLFSKKKTLPCGAIRCDTISNVWQAVRSQ